MSTIRHEGVGAANRPSPSIWNSFRLTRTPAIVDGAFFHEDFLAIPAETWASGEPRPTIGPFTMDCDDDTVTSALTDLGGAMDIETDADDNDAWALFTAPFCKTVLNSRQPWAFEAAIEVGDITGDQGMFIGLAESAALDRDVVADNAGGLDTESLVGFRMLTADPDSFDAVYRLDNGTTVQVSDDVTNNAAITAGGGTVASLVNDTVVKLGMKFDGRDSLQVFVNGYKVATATLATSTFPDNVAMGMIIALKTGAAAAESAAIHWARAAYEEAT